MEKNKPQTDNLYSSDHVAVLLRIILEPAMAGGLSEKEAEKIYNTIMESITSVHKSQNQFNDLLNDIINKLSLPIISSFGVSIPNNHVDDNAMLN